MQPLITPFSASLSKQIRVSSLALVAYRWQSLPFSQQDKLHGSTPLSRLEGTPQPDEYNPSTFEKEIDVDV